MAVGTGERLIRGWESGVRCVERFGYVRIVKQSEKF
jgi:hypothetical protein